MVELIFFLGLLGLAGSLVMLLIKVLAKKGWEPKKIGILAAISLVLFITGASLSGNETTTQKITKELEQKTTIDNNQSKESQEKITPQTKTDQQVNISKTSVPEQPPPKPKGLGVSRAKIIAAFAEKDDAFSGKEGTPIKEQSNWVGQSKDGLATLQLIGPPEDLTNASVMFVVAKDNLESAASGMIHMYILLSTIFPDWKDCNNWIISAIDQVTKQGKEKITIEKNGKLVQFQFTKEIGLWSLTVEPK